MFEPQVCGHSTYLMMSHGYQKMHDSLCTTSHSQTVRISERIGSSKISLSRLCRLNLPQQIPNAPTGHCGQPAQIPHLQDGPQCIRWVQSQWGPKPHLRVFEAPLFQVLEWSQVFHRGLYEWDCQGDPLGKNGSMNMEVRVYCEQACVDSMPLSRLTSANT